MLCFLSCIYKDRKIRDTKKEITNIRTEKIMAKRRLATGEVPLKELQDEISLQEIKKSDIAQEKKAISKTFNTRKQFLYQLNHNVAHHSSRDP
jgi:hypothetical protein